MSALAKHWPLERRLFPTRERRKACTWFYILYSPSDINFQYQHGPKQSRSTISKREGEGYRQNLICGAAGEGWSQVTQFGVATGRGLEEMLCQDYGIRW